MDEKLQQLIEDSRRRRQQENPLLDQSASALAPQPQASTGAPVDPLAQMVTESRVRRAKENLAFANVLGLDPATEAKVQDLSARTGMAPEQVRRDMAAAERKAQTPEWPSILPPVLEQLAKSPSTAARSVDDLQSLNNIAAAHRRHEELYSTPARFLGHGIVRSYHVFSQAYSLGNVVEFTEMQKELDAEYTLAKEGKPPKDPNVFYRRDARVGAAASDLTPLSPEERDKRYAELRTQISDARLDAMANSIESMREAGKIPLDPLTIAASLAASADEYTTAEKFKQVFKIMGIDPVESFIGMAAESFLPSLASVAGGAAGSVVPGVGQYAGAFAGSYSVDEMIGLLGILTDLGVDLGDPQAIDAALSDSALMEKAKQQAGLHALPVAGFDTLAWWVAKLKFLPVKLLPKWLGTGYPLRLLEMGPQALAQGVFGATGEALGEVAAKQPINPYEIFAEFAGEIGSTPIEVMASTRAAAKEYAGTVRTKRFREAQLEINKLVQASEIQKRDPSLMQTFLQSVSADADVYIDGEEAGAFAQENPDLAKKMGLTEELVSTSIEEGTDLVVKLAPLHANLSAEEFTKAVEILKVGPGAVSMKGLEKMDTAAELDQMITLYQEENENEVKLRQEISRFREEALTAGRSAEEVDASARILEAFIRRNNLFHLAERINVARGTEVTDEPTAVAQEEEIPAGVVLNQEGEPLELYPGRAEEDAVVYSPVALETAPVAPAYLRMENPLVVQEGQIVPPLAAAREAGHDGIIVKDAEGDVVEAVVSSDNEQTLPAPSAPQLPEDIEQRAAEEKGPLTLAAMENEDVEIAAAEAVVAKLPRRKTSTKKDVKLGAQLLHMLNRYARQGALLACGIATDMKTRGASDILGKVVHNPLDVATICQIYRDKRFETLRWIFVNDADEVVGHLPVTSRLPGTTLVYPGQVEGNLVSGMAGAAYIHEMGKQLGAAKMYLVHNHPSGEVSPSVPDSFLIQSANRFIGDYAKRNNEAMVPLVASIIINHNVYSYQTLEGENLSTEIKHHRFTRRKDVLAEPDVAHPVLDIKVEGPRDAAAAVQAVLATASNNADAVVLIGRSPRGRVRTALEVSLDKDVLSKDKKRALAKLRRFSAATGSASYILGVNNFYSLKKRQISALVKLINQGVLLDVVSMDGVALTELANLMPQQEAQFGTARGLAPIVSEPTAPYGPAKPAVNKDGSPRSGPTVYEIISQIMGDIGVREKVDIETTQYTAAFTYLRDEALRALGVQVDTVVEPHPNGEWQGRVWANTGSLHVMTRFSRAGGVPVVAWRRVYGRHLELSHIVKVGDPADRSGLLNDIYAAEVLAAARLGMVVEAVLVSGVTQAMFDRHYMRSRRVSVSDYFDDNGMEVVDQEFVRRDLRSPKSKAPTTEGLEYLNDVLHYWEERYGPADLDRLNYRDLAKKSLVDGLAENIGRGKGAVRSRTVLSSRTESGVPTERPGHRPPFGARAEESVATYNTVPGGTSFAELVSDTLRQMDAANLPMGFEQGLVRDVLTGQLVLNLDDAAEGMAKAVEQGRIVLEQGIEEPVEAQGVRRHMRGGAEPQDNLRVVADALIAENVQLIPDVDGFETVEEALEAGRRMERLTPIIREKPIPLRYRSVCAGTGAYGNAKMAHPSHSYPNGRNTLDIPGCGRLAFALRNFARRIIPLPCWNSACYAESLKVASQGAVASVIKGLDTGGQLPAKVKEEVRASVRENGLEATQEKYKDRYRIEFKPVHSAIKPQLLEYAKTQGVARTEKKFKRFFFVNGEWKRLSLLEYRATTGDIISPQDVEDFEPLPSIVSLNLDPEGKMVGQDVRFGVDNDGGAFLSLAEVMDVVAEKQPRIVSVYSSAYHTPPPPHRLSRRTIICVTVSGWHSLSETFNRLRWAEEARANGWNVILREVTADPAVFSAEQVTRYNRVHNALMKTDFFLMQQPLHVGKRHGEALYGIPGCCVGSEKNPRTCDQCEVNEGLHPRFQEHWNIAEEERGEERVLLDVPDYHGNALRAVLEQADQPREALVPLAAGPAPVSSVLAEQYFDLIEDAPRTEGIEEAEQAWAGGVADFGDREAAVLVQAMPGYFDYRSALEDAARQTLGDSFTLYRLMPREQLEEWRAGSDMGPVATTTNLDTARRFSKFAGYRGREDLVVVAIATDPNAIVMAGKREESEIIIDANMVEARNVTEVPVDAVSEGQRIVLEQAAVLADPKVQEKLKDTAITDEGGRPLMLFHGTLVTGIKEFRHGHDFGVHFGSAIQAAIRLRYDAGMINTYRIDYRMDYLKEAEAKGIKPMTFEQYLLSRRTARFKNENVYPVYLAIKNPLRMEDLQSWTPENMLAYFEAQEDKFKVSPPWHLRQSLESLAEAAHTPVSVKARGFFDIIAKWLRTNGYDGIVYENEFEIDTPEHRYWLSEEENELIPPQKDSYIAFDAEQIVPALTLYQEEGADEPRRIVRGQTIIENDRYLIKLFQEANESTLIHELAHVFFFELRQLVRNGDADEEMIKNWEILQRWLGVTLHGGITKEQHEKFARGFEYYAREGKAPSEDLETAFAYYRTWLIRIYKTIKSLVEVPSEVAGVFDRLLATEQEIDLYAEDIGLRVRTGKEMKALGLKTEEQAYLKKLVRGVKDKAKILHQKQKDRHRAALLRQWLEEARAAVKEERVYRLRKQLAEKDRGLNIDMVRDAFGQETVENLNRVRVGIVQEGGVAPEAVVAEFEYTTVKEMIDELLSAPTQKERITQIVNAKQAEHDAAFDPSEPVLDNDLMEEYLDTMGRWIGRALGAVEKITVRTMKVFAMQKMMDMKLSDALRIDRFLGAFQKAMRAERQAIAKGDFKKAMEANRQARLNYQYARRVREIQREVDKLLRRAKRLKGNKGTIAPNYLEMIRFLLMRYELANTTPNDMAKLPTLASLLKENTDDSFEDQPVFSDWLHSTLDARKYTKLTVREIEELSNLIKYLEKVGRDEADKAKLRLTSMGGIQLDEAVAMVTEPMKGLKGKKLIKESDRLKNIRAWVRGFLAGTRQFLFVMRVLDGFTALGPKGKIGPNEKLLHDGLLNAYRRKLALVKAAGDKLAGPLTHFKDRLGNREFPKEFVTIVPVPKIMRDAGQTWTFERVLSIALNMGCEYNKQAILDGYGLTEDDLTKLLSGLTEADWQAIQSIWNTVNEHWGQLAATYERRYGIRPVKVEATPYLTPRGTMLAGGYYPIRFDSGLDSQTAEREEQDYLKHQANAAFPPSAASGFMKSRRGTAGKPVRLSLGVLNQHIEYVTTYIAYAETVRDVDRIMHHPAYRAEVRRIMGGDDFYKGPTSFRRLLKDIVGAEREMLNAFDVAINKGRTMSTRYILGLNMGVVLQQPSSLASFINDVGVGRIIKGIAYIAPNVRRAYEEMIEMSPVMKERAGKFDRDVMIALESDTSKLANARDLLNFFLVQASDTLTLLPAWWGAYNEEIIRNGGDSAAAIAVADKVVAAGQPMMHTLDMAAFQRSKKGGHVLMTMFSSFTMKYGNRVWIYREGKRQGKLDWGSYIRFVVLDRIMPPMMISLFFAFLWGDDPDLEDIIMDVLAYQFIGIPMVREIATSALASYRYSRGKGFRPDRNMRMPAFTAIELLNRAFNSLVQWNEDMDNERKKDNVFWAIAELLSFIGGIPVAPLAKRIKKGMEQIESGDYGPGAFIGMPNYKPKDKHHGGE